MITLLLFISLLGASEKPVAQSPATRVSFVELFTSESCSSCPPADKWFSNLSKQQGLWKTFVPAVFHVDYWNHLDWKDEFSSAAMTERQRAHTRTWTKPSVYTPGVIINGREWQGWRMSNFPPTPEKAEAGVLTIDKSGTGYKVRFTPAEAPEGDMTVHIALLGMGIAKKVTSGENSGRDLAHDFTVLHWEKTTAAKSGKELSGVFKELKSDKKTSRRAVIAWISKEGSAEPVQVTGAFL